MLLKLFPASARSLAIRALILFISASYACFSSSVSQAAWTTQPFPTGETLYSVYFVDINTGYAVGNLGTVVKTVNGGNLWTIAASAGAAILRDVYFIDTHRGWAAGDSGVYFTNDGAASWSGPLFGFGFNTILFNQSGTGFAGGQNGFLYRTDDGGLTWPTIISTFDGNPIVSVEFVDSSNGFLVTSSTAAYTTSNGGNTWTPLAPIPPAESLSGATDSYWVDTLHGWIVGNGASEVAFTTDGGATWTGVNALGGNTDFTAIHFTDLLNGWAVADDGSIMSTVDGGANWVLETSTGSMLHDVFVAPDGSVYAVGEPDVISKDTTASVVLGVIKQAWALGGTAPLSTISSVPTGGKIVFLLYVKNTSSTAVADPAFIDDLHSSTFGYVPDSIYMNDVLIPLADSATDQQIFAATDPAVGVSQSDAIGLPDDFAAACTGSDPCPGAATNTITFGASTINPNNFLIIQGNSTIAFRFMVTVK